MGQTVLIVAGSLLIVQTALAAGPRVDIVIGEKAPPLERRAAEDIATDLKKIYDADVRITTAAPEEAENVIFVGSPETDEKTKKQIAENWPDLSAQGHVVRTIKYRGKPALFIGGGSPVAAYWAASEYAHSLGVRSMLYGDLYPVAPRAFTSEGFDTILEPRDETIEHADFDPFPTGYTAWSIEDQRRRLRQLARLKYRNLAFWIYSWQPFVHYEFDGVKKQTGVLWYGWQLPVTGDTAGRSVFKGAKLFENPDFVGKITYEQRLEVGKKFMSGLIEEAHSLGIAVAISTNPSEFPKEFVAVLPETMPIPEPGSLSIRSLQKPKGAEFTAPEKFHITALKETYPRVDKWMARESDLPKYAYCSLVFDSSSSFYETSRYRFGASLTDEAACRSLTTPICGDGVHPSVLKAKRQISEADVLIRNNDAFLGMPAPDLILRHYEITDPPPDWWAKVRDNYLGAMNDMYRANTRAREGGRSYTLYLARRCEFGFEYMNCVEAVRKAGIAKSKGDKAEQRAQLEKAVESMNAACSALAAVSRDQSDRGMIAVCNEFGYRPLLKELEKLDAEEEKK